MSVYQNLRLLIELQKKDTGLDLLRGRLDALPAAERQTQDALAEEKKSLASHREQAKQLALAKNALERDLKECEESTRKHQAELNQVKSNDAFKALLAEIESGKKRAGELETEILEAMDRLEAASARDAELAGAFAETEKTAAARLAALRAEAAKAENAIADAQAERDAFAKSVEPDFLDKYERLRELRGGVAVCAVRVQGANCACSACNMTLRPQAAVAVRKTDAIAQCENCQRMLFLPEGQ